MSKLSQFLLAGALLANSAGADGPKDNIAEDVRPIPAPGIEVPPQMRAELEAGVAKLGKTITDLRKHLAKKPELLALLPDVEIYHKSVNWALSYNQFYRKQEFSVAQGQLMTGMKRASELKIGSPSWLSDTGLVVRGYRSAIDGSVQPYGIIVPAGFIPGDAPRRLDFWFHGRGEKLSELSFINGRERTPGHFAPPNTFVLHPYGRYSNANKFAGEADLFEALEHAKKYYPVDEQRLTVRGFSMGGAACWQFAVHYPGRWAAAAPGAGFSETPEFLKFFQEEDLKPTWYEKKLWHLYDCTDYAVNLFNLPTVAYSGEVDRQKQAADIMEQYLAREGLNLTHLVGPGMGHRYDPASKIEIERRISSIAARGRNPVPQTVKFATYTLRYNQSHWIRLDELGEHWERASVHARIVNNRNEVRVSTTNITALTLAMPAGYCPLEQGTPPRVVIDDQTLTGTRIGTDLSWSSSFQKKNGKWQPIDGPAVGLRKSPGLQGPIDDAFMSSFLFVRPTGSPLNSKVGNWAKAEMAHAEKHWQLQFRGIVREKKDSEVSDKDISEHNLILWGDPASNAVLRRVLNKTPLKWDSKSLAFGARKFAASNHVPAMIFPNPLNPKRYIVVNSGFTYREYDYLNNARQVPKLPDWAIIDIDQPVTSRHSGGIADAGFFNERWQLK
jgi:hypothetical protein